MKYTGRNGTLRIYDSAAIIAHGAQANMAVYVYDDSGGTYTDKTAEAYADDTNYTGNFWVDSPDKIYVGCTTKFAMMQFLQGGGVLAVGAGALVAKYYNGSEFTALTVTDGTASGGNTLAQDGYISWKIPIDWALRGNANLDADMYFIELAPTAYPTTEPSADILAPVDGQYFNVGFAKMDFSGPIGRPKTDEILIMDRGTYTANAHYIEGSDEKIYEPLDISFSCDLDDAVNKTYIFTALQCGNFNDSAYWTTTGTTSKATTKNDGTTANPSFKDSNKKTVNIQVLFSGATYDEGWAYYEVYFPDSEQSIAESDEAVTLTCKGAVYGVIERIHAFGVRY